VPGAVIPLFFPKKKLHGGYTANGNASTDSKQKGKTGARGGSRTIRVNSKSRVVNGVAAHQGSKRYRNGTVFT